ncbi:hypothetical protein ABH922_003722 [Rhodococcus sp. 27YEA15]|uniref:hypothetical protein n=1 Tax=Rhodococcus sp. 27YEA15 TaxID=3156259 RepID=UPI003C7A437E
MTKGPGPLSSLQPDVWRRVGPPGGVRCWRYRPVVHALRLFLPVPASGNAPVAVIRNLFGGTSVLASRVVFALTGFGATDDLPAEG